MTKAHGGAMMTEIITQPPEHKIYALVDPRTDEIRYIGFTSQSLDVRLNAHIRRARTKSRLWVCNWMRQLLAENLTPKIQLLESVSGNWQERESYWITEGHRLEWPITNLTLGGEGTLGHKHTLESRRKMSESQKGKISPWRGKHLSDEHKRKLSIAKLGKPGHPHTEEEKRKLSEMQKGGRAFSLGKHPSEETRRRQSEAQKGGKMRPYIHWKTGRLTK
jgi:hypothetical protein